MEVYSIASISLQRVDVSKEPILCNFTTLQKMTHSVITEFGYSKSTYWGDTLKVPLNPPPQGLGRGNGVSPPIWYIVSTTLLNCLRKAGHGAAFKCWISGDTTKLVGYYFVNDSTIFHISLSTNTPTEDTIKISQEGINMFQEQKGKRDDKSEFRKQIGTSWSLTGTRQENGT